ncbi:hypothetical protein ACFPAF_17070 [Hymenobacter endophyticus]|uniref:Uncharacterized protein n=1 Tax=Hymenobacter endophyticus TaxID=3076335 RepID=A0ABU3TLA8_9BACT|nr:hypothetical protein [Hymenobacter endophyticus]MDU0372117.1 hypothetical protein [Hymenobacter endophyticus]
MAQPTEPFKQRALFKMRVYFTHVKPGTAGQFDMYSFDTSGRYRVADPAAYGLRHLKGEAEKMGGRIVRAIIYDNQASGKPEYTRLEKGVWTR